MVGGDVAVTEIKEAQERGISVEVDTSFEPNPAQVTKRKAKNPNLDPTPLKTYMEANAPQADETIISLANKEQIKKNMTGLFHNSKKDVNNRFLM